MNIPDDIKEEIALKLYTLKGIKHKKRKISRTIHKAIQAIHSIRRTRRMRKRT
jgi:hypothetical protein